MSEPNTFVDYLVRLTDKEDRAALAALRSGLGKKPGEAAQMLPYVARWLPSGEDSFVAVRFLVASLFAVHRHHTTEHVSFARALRQLADKEGGNDGIERRFVALLDADSEDLDHHLIYLMQYLASKDPTPINWFDFERDLRRLMQPDTRDPVRLHWSRDFWSPNRPSQESQD